MNGAPLAPRPDTLAGLDYPTVIFGPRCQGQHQAPLPAEVVARRAAPRPLALAAAARHRPPPPGRWRRARGDRDGLADRRTARGSLGTSARRPRNIDSRRGWTSARQGGRPSAARRSGATPRAFGAARPRNHRALANHVCASDRFEKSSPLAAGSLQSPHPRGHPIRCSSSTIRLASSRTLGSGSARNIRVLSMQSAGRRWNTP